MSWILIVIIAHFFYAGVFVIDRYLLKKGFPNPINYSFWSAFLGIVVLVLIPFGFSIPETSQIIFSFVAGVIWLLASILFYFALYKGESSRVVPTIGGLIPVCTLIFSFLFLGERLNGRELLAFCFLVGGGLFISLFIKGDEISFKERIIRVSKNLGLLLASALFFAIYFVMVKYVFAELGFINGLIWVRLGAVFASLAMLISSSFRRMIFVKIDFIKGRVGQAFIFSKIVGVAAGFLQYLAIFLGSVTLVNSLQGVQYLFLLFLAFLFFRKIPSLKEQLDRRVLIQKIIAIILIGVGLAILVI